MPDYRQLFTIDLRDLYGQKLDKLAAKSDKQFARIEKGIGGVAAKGRVAAKSIDEINRRIDHLTKAKKLTVDLTAVKAANREIKALQKEKDKLEGLGGRPRLNTGLGGLTKSFLVGGSIFLGASTLTNAVGNAIDATSKYQKFEAVLSNTFGSRGAAQDAMTMLTDFASKTPFQVDNLTGSFVKLANQGFVPTVKELTSLGDLASSTGKDFDQLVEAMIDAQVGEFERLKEFGIRAQKEGDKVMFTFKGQSQTVKFTSEAIREYILSLGQAQGVSGAMAKISKTTGGQISNLKDNVDLMWKAVGDRLNPSIKSATGGLSKLVGTVRDWFEIPMSQKLREENALITAQVKAITNLNEGNDTRKSLLTDLVEQFPELFKNIDIEKVKNDELLKVLEKINKEYQGRIELAKNSELKKLYENELGSAQNELNRKLVMKELASSSDPADRQLALRMRTWGEKLSFMSLDDIKNFDPEKDWGEGTQSNVDYLRGKINEQDRKLQDLELLMPEDMTKGGSKKKGAGKVSGSNLPGTSGKSLDTAGINSVSSGTAVKNINISIGNLVNGGVNIHTSEFKEGMTKAKDIVAEALLTAVNDANLAGGN